MVVISLGMILTVKYGLTPRPIRQINPTEFENAESIGAVVFRRLLAQWDKHPVVVIGSSPFLKNYDLSWNGFIKTAQAESKGFAKLYEDQTLRPLVPSARLVVQKISNLNEIPFDEIRQHVMAGERVLLHTVATLATHSQENSLSVRLQKEIGRPVLAISQQSFAVDRDGLKYLQPICNTNDQQQVNLGCEGVRYSKTYFRKKLPRENFVAGLEQHGIADFVLFIFEP